MKSSLWSEWETSVASSSLTLKTTGTCFRRLLMFEVTLCDQAAGKTQNVCRWVKRRFTHLVSSVCSAQQVNSLITSCRLHLWAESGAGDKPAGCQTISEQNVTRRWCSWALITLRHKLNNENTLHVLFCCFIMFGEKSACVLFLSLTVGFLFYDTVFMIIVSFCNKRRKTHVRSN